jgi:hypothetical protein
MLYFASCMAIKSRKPKLLVHFLSGGNSLNNGTSSTRSTLSKAVLHSN